jgi:hypothetical protein
MKSSFSKWIVSPIDSPEFDPTPKIIWVILIIMFLVSVSMIMAHVPKVGDTVPIASGTAADLEKTPATVPATGKADGGIEVQVDETGSPRFLVDIAAMDWKKLEGTKWYAKPVEVVRQVGSNTAENVKGNPWSYIITAGAGYLIASGTASDWADQAKELLGGGSDDKDKQGQQAAQPAAKPTPAVDVQGQYNSVTVPATAIDGPIVVNGAYNNVTVTEPAFQTL